MQSAAGATPSVHPLPHLMRIVWLQVLRRKDVYLLCLVVLLFGCGAAIARITGADSPQMRQFLASLGFSVGSGAAALLAIIVAVGQIPSEIESRTIYPILAKPVRRDQFVWGKFLPTMILSSSIFLACILLTCAIVPALPMQSRLMLAQALILKLVALADLVMLLFVLSLLVPSSLAFVIGLVLHFFGGFILNAAGHFFGGSAAGSMFSRILPDFSLLDQFQRYVEGGSSLSFGGFLFVFLYGVAWFGILTLATLQLFRRRSL